MADSGAGPGASYETIRVRSEHGGQVVRIVLAAPPGNVLSARMMGEIVLCLHRDAAGAGVKAVVFEGEGEHFSFGASVQEHRREQAPAMIRAFHRLFKDLLACAVPTVALVRGQCLGGAMELAAFCNLVIAAPSARFGQPEIRLGVLPPVAALILPALVGQARADDLVLTGRSIDAQTAQAWGLVYQVAADAESALQELLSRHVLPRSAAALRHACRASRWAWHRDLPRALDEMERFYLDELMATHDANEGLAAFLEKRDPEWRDR